MAERKPDAALKRIEAFLTREPKFYPALLAVADLRRQAGAKPEEVTALLGDAVKASPIDAQPRLVLVDYLLSQGQNKASRAAAQEGIAAMPEDFQLLDAVGRTQLANGETQQAISSFKKISAAQPSLAGPHLRLASAYMIAKDYPSATKSLRDALNVDPNLLAAQRGLVQVALADKRVDEALRVARGLQKQHPNDPIGYLIEGEIQSGQRAWAPAIGAVHLALERNRSTAVATRLHALYASAGRAADADGFATSWLRERPTDAGFLAHLGAVALERKDYAVAEARYRQVLAVSPSDVVALNNIAWLMVRQRKSGALSFAERANQLAPDEPLILDTLASALAADKQVEGDRMAEEGRREGAGCTRPSAKPCQVADPGGRAPSARRTRKLTMLGAKFAGHAEVADLLRAL
ncbi:MAG: tetratricopeptide repeat protein [Ideonella sp.]|nr:tetratricopeptide repeat protein [Ideonella sp.]